MMLGLSCAANVSILVVFFIRVIQYLCTYVYLTMLYCRFHLFRLLKFVRKLRACFVATLLWSYVIYIKLIGFLSAYDNNISLKWLCCDSNSGPSALDVWLNQAPSLGAILALNLSSAKVYMSRFAKQTSAVTEMSSSWCAFAEHFHPYSVGS